MADVKTSRVAGEAFTLITGADPDKLQIYRTQPAEFESGPNENPDDPIGDMDPDEGLMWPDQQKVEQWWADNSPRFPKGPRYFMGAPADARPLYRSAEERLPASGVPPLNICACSNPARRCSTPAPLRGGSSGCSRKWCEGKWPRNISWP